MGLEALTPSTFIAGLTKEWPTAGEPKSQGDDHIRLLKGVLQNTFPNATGPFYLPSTMGVTGGGSLVITVAGQNQTIFVSTAAGNVAASLPALTGTNVGWACEIIKTTPDQNAITVTPPSGNILSSWGAVATVRVGAAMCPAKLIWDGTTWLCAKAGPLIGSTENFDGATIPAGYLNLDGTAFSGTTFAELALALGTTTLRDKRGRVEAGVDTGINRLLVAMPGNQAVGGVGGVDNVTASGIPAHRHSIRFVDVDHTHGYEGVYDPTFGTNAGPNGGGGMTYYPTGKNTAGRNGAVGYVDDGVGNANLTGISGGVTNMGLVQPTIVVQKLIRAC